MIDAMTRKPLLISNEGTAWPYLMIPVSQLDDVCQLLDKHEIHYSVGENFISIDGAPETVFINFGRGADSVPIKLILDSVH